MYLQVFGTFTYLTLWLIANLPQYLYLAYTCVSQRHNYYSHTNFTQQTCTLHTIITSPTVINFLLVQAFLVLLPYRWYNYIKINGHYQLIEFSYLMNTLTLLYLWLPISDDIRARLFPTIYTLVTGPLVMSTMAMQQPLKLQSESKMTSIFIHMYPSLAVWGIKW